METINLTFNTTVDKNDGGESGTGLSLREAINITNETPENEYIIELQGGSTYALNVNSDDPGDNHLDVTGNVTIRANGEERAVIDASGLAEPDIVLHVSGGGNVNLENLTLTGGAAEGEGIASGGGIYINESSTVNITDSLITGNTARFAGGGIFADLGSSVTLIDSEVTNNQSGDSGGGISIFGAEVNVYSSSISGNAAGFVGGGIGIDGNSESEPVVRIVNSTINDNTAENSGGGIHLDNFDTSSENINVEISNSTIVNNVANADGGGIRTRKSNSIELENSIIANNFAAGGDIPSDVYGVVIASTVILFGFLETEIKSIIGDGNNLIGTFDSGDVSGTIGTGSDLINVDPLLTQIENSNGTVVAYAPSEGSPAIDAGNNANIQVDRLDLDDDGSVEEPIAIDQLGNERIFNDTVDLGAVEFGSSAIATPPATNEDPTNTVYRFFNRDSGVHFYTANETERSAVLELPNYSFEGESYLGVDPLSGMPAPQPVYRFLNQDTGVHLYTISETERESVAELDNFTFEGEAFSAYAMEEEGTIPIFRFFNSMTGAHFYTPSTIERDAVEDLADFQSEGIAYYALPVSDF